jgi:hypothetical protein
MTWHAPEHTCTNCGVCFGDYGSDCSWPNGCYGHGTVMQGWKPRTEAGIEKQRQRENLQHATTAMLAPGASPVAQTGVPASA